MTLKKIKEKSLDLLLCTIAGTTILSSIISTQVVILNYKNATLERRLVKDINSLLEGSSEEETRKNHLEFLQTIYGNRFSPSKSITSSMKLSYLNMFFNEENHYFTYNLEDQTIYVTFDDASNYLKENKHSTTYE